MQLNQGKRSKRLKAFSIQISACWTNLSALLVQLIYDTFHDGRKNTFAVDFASNANTPKFCQYIISSYIQDYPNFVSNARKFGLRRLLNTLKNLKVIDEVSMTMMRRSCSRSVLLKRHI